MNILEPIATAPRDGTFILVFGPSGYTSTPWRAAVCWWDGYHDDGGWKSHTYSWFEDGGEDATHWTPLPSASSLPETLTKDFKPRAFKPGDPVSKVGGDYSFDGTVVSVFSKLPREGKPPAVRYVVEDDRGVLHVYSAKNLVGRKA